MSVVLNCLLSLVLILIDFFCTSAQARIRETVVLNRLPTWEEVHRWNQEPGRFETRGFLFRSKDPGEWDLLPLLELKGSQRTQVVIERSPPENLIPIWRKLANLPIELVLLENSGFPYPSEVATLQLLQFKRMTWVLPRYPTEGEAQSLANFPPSLELTFATRAYPRYQDRRGLESLPPILPLLFVQDYWPGYIHMDVLNFLPNPRSIRIVEALPEKGGELYLKHVQNLQQLGIQSYTLPAPIETGRRSFWESFSELSVQWILQGPIPTDEDLHSFFHSGTPLVSRTLTVDRDELDSSEIQRLHVRPELIHWIHQ